MTIAQKMSSSRLSESEILIPYIVNDVNKNIYPLKINEFLAVGVPVVMNAFAKLPEFQQQVAVATDKDDFVRKLKLEVENDTSDKIKQRIQLASESSWEQRTEQFSAILEKYI